MSDTDSSLIAIFNVLDVLVRAVNTIARYGSNKEVADEIFSLDAVRRLNDARLTINQDDTKERVQVAMQILLTLTGQALHKSLTIDDHALEPRNLLKLIEELKNHSSVQQVVTENVVHTTGHCTCGGEGDCVWCRTHCLMCGIPRPNNQPCQNPDCRSYHISRDPSLYPNTFENKSTEGFCVFTDDTDWLVVYDEEIEPRSPVLAVRKTQIDVRVKQLLETALWLLTTDK